MITFAGMKRMFTCLAALVSVGSLSLVSCDKAKDLVRTATEKIKELKDGQDGGSDEKLVTTVTTVGESDGKKIIMSERRLVVLEFYSDT